MAEVNGIEKTDSSSLGLILGEVVAAGVWLVADYITDHMGSFLTQI